MTNLNPMATWKERGEVPDSEDEFDFDSDELELPPLHRSTTTKDADPTPPAKRQDIWDIPTSSIEGDVAARLAEPTRPRTPPREPYTQLLSSPLSEPPSDLSSGPEDSPTPERRTVRLSKTYARQLSPDPLANDIETLVRSTTTAQAVATPHDIETPLGNTSTAQVVATPHGIETPVGNIPRAQAVAIPGSVNTERQGGNHGDHHVPAPTILSPRDLTDNSTRDSIFPTYDERIHGPLAPVRTFRPRKPIQEHPYALENARYSNTFKSHGLKPLRFEGGSQSTPRRRAVQEDSQETEFQEESQETGDVNDGTQETADDHLPAFSEESQLDTQFDGQHARAPSLPSTPTTSLPPHRGNPSSQPGSAETNCTSVGEVGEQDEFPPLQELIKVPVPHTSSSVSAKRKGLSNLSARKKRLKTGQANEHQGNSTRDEGYSVSPSPLIPSAHRLPQTPLLPRLILPDDISLSPPSPARARQESHSRSLSPLAPVLRQDREPLPDVPIDLTAELDGTSTDESAHTSSESEAEVTDSDAVKKAARRLRGVLPPSYLRLNETDKHRARRALQSARIGPGAAEKFQRKGVAQHRTTGVAVPAARFDVFEDSDEDLVSEAPPRRDDSPVQMVQTALVIETDDDDGNSSAMEDNRVDAMIPTKKRQSSRTAKPGPAKRMKPVGRVPLQATQPRITTHFQGLDGSPPRPARQSVPKPKRRKRLTGQANSKRNKGGRQKQGPVPRLSILDVIEPDAPQFLKVAARSARQHVDLGRSSPSRKIFQMATRWDHVDVNRVMQKWRGGQLKPRLPPGANPRVLKRKEQAHPVPRPAEATVRTWPITKQRKLVKQVSTGGQVTYETVATPSHPTTPLPHPKQTPTRLDRPPFRPAQLETASTKSAKYSFHSRKRDLDNLWRKSLHNRYSAAPSSISSIRQGDETRRSISPPPENRIPPTPTEPTVPAHLTPHQRPKSKFRKKFAPKAVDTSAPQFSVANEPLPTSTAHSVEDLVEAAEPLPEANKLTGLGPFGTQPTHHFEIFPLDTDVFFHESTLLGSGRVDKATDNWDDETRARLRARVSFTLDGKPLRWGPWDDQVSSELGNLMDWLSDHFQGGHDTPNPAHSTSALQASDFVLSYVQDSLSLPDPSATQYFASRIIETIGGFLDRFNFAQDPHELRATPEVLNVLCRMLTVVSTCTHICRKSSALIDLRMPMEDLLIKASRTAARALLSNGIDDVLQFLEDSRQLAFRQRGIRPRHAVVHTWVVLMTVLEVANIPRSGFWDIVYSVLIPKDVNSETNCQNMEKLWKTMFALLPLREFDSQGVVSPGIRRLVSMDGWGLPQRLIKRVFELYKQNDRQAASFNDYCRALVSRCHYLTREWGWSKCGGIIGTIFDFFGSQNLSHLRNEEAYKSPRFLEELASGPTLAVEREDRCFHIFLKFVAVAIKRLRNGKASNEIRNLIARLMPNHSRAYLKEQSLYSHDLASLRNHHDLLCTLFWAAPQDLRPGAHLIEALIKPADTHKDACLVNLRAWTQLARYVVSTEHDNDVFNVFQQWQRNIFRQLMDQFETAASDAQQQYLALSKEDSQGITQTRIDLVVSANKMAAKEIIHACVNASRDVLSYARGIPAATFALNTLQLEEVFRHFSVSPPTLDWAVLRSALDAINSYLFKIDSLCQQQQSQSASGRNDCISQVMTLLHHELSSSLFSAARCIMATDGIQPKLATAMVDKSVCVELVIVLAAKLFAGFSKAGLVDGSKALSPGKYGLFGREVHKLPLGHRKHLVLFIAVLLKQGLWEVDPLGPSLLEVWLLAIVKPRQFLAYENQLAEGLKQRNEPFVPETVIGLSINPDYGSNRKLFQAAVSYMRQSLRDAPPGTRRTLVSTFSATLQTVMEQIKSDLRVVVLDSTEHPSYVTFIRDIISLLRSHGTDICAVDEFFYQINKEYSPSLLDPRLHVAGITSYGLRLGEGDAKIVPQLFYYLYNNFKVALLNDKLGNEARMLRRGMEDERILGFVLGQMVPAIAKAAVRVGGVFPLLGVYCDTLAHLFAGDIAGHELTEEMLPHVLSLVQTVLRCLCDLGTGGGATISAEQLHVAVQLCGIVNVLWPPMQALCYTDRPSECLRELELLYGRLRGWLDGTISHLDSAILQRGAVPLRSELFGGLLGVTQSLLPPVTATMFPESIVTDVRKNWVISDSAVTIQAPGKARGPSSTQSGQGIRKPAWDVFELVESLCEELKVWRIRQGETFPGKHEGWRSGARGVGGSVTDGLIF